MNVIRNAFFEIRPDSFEAHVDAVATNPGLDRIPDEREEDPVVNDKRASVHAPYVAIGDWKPEMIEGAGHAVEDYLYGGQSY